MFALVSCAPSPVPSPAPVMVAQSTAPISVDKGPTANSSPLAPSAGCWPRSSALDVHKTLPGSLLYYDDATHQSTALDLATFQASNTRLSYRTTSLQRNVAALLDPSSHRIYFLTHDGEASYPVPPKVFLDGFVADGSAKLDVMDARANNLRPNAGTSDEFYTVSPSTGRSDFHRIFLPNYNVAAYSPVADYLTAYSPDLRFVLYPALIQGSYLSALFDTTSARIVWTGGMSSAIPVWRPDSNAVFVVVYDQATKDQFYALVSTTGEIQRLPLDSRSYAPEPYWSPSSRYLAFREHRGRGDFLVIFDTEARAIIDPCFSLGQLPLAPVWSPQGEEMASTSADSPDQRTMVSILDLADKVVFELPSVGTPGPVDLYGWITWQSH